MINLSANFDAPPATSSDLDDLIQAAITKNILDGDRASKKGDFQRAEELYSYAINLAEVKFGATAAAVGYLLAILADLYELQNRKEDALALNKRVQEILTNYVKFAES